MSYIVSRRATSLSKNFKNSKISSALSNIIISKNSINNNWFLIKYVKCINFLDDDGILLMCL